MQVLLLLALLLLIERFATPLCCSAACPVLFLQAIAELAKRLKRLNTARAPRKLANLLPELQVLLPGTAAALSCCSGGLGFAPLPEALSDSHASNELRNKRKAIGSISSAREPRKKQPGGKAGESVQKCAKKARKQRQWWTLKL